MCIRVLDSDNHRDVFSSQLCMKLQHHNKRSRPREIARDGTAIAKQPVPKLRNGTAQSSALRFVLSAITLTRLFDIIRQTSGRDRTHSSIELSVIKKMRF